jgi:hypothetical protein
LRRNEKNISSSGILAFAHELLQKAATDFNCNVKSLEKSLYQPRELLSSAGLGIKDLPTLHHCTIPSLQAVEDEDSGSTELAEVLSAIASREGGTKSSRTIRRRPSAQSPNRDLIPYL